MAVDNNGNSLIYDISTGKWGPLNFFDNGIVGSGQNNIQVNAVSCTESPSAYCVAVDNNGNELSFGGVEVAVPPLFSTTGIPVPYFSNRATIMAAGGQGGDGGSFGGFPNSASQFHNNVQFNYGATEEQGGQGGHGAVVIATIPVTPSTSGTPEYLYACAGTQGAPGAQNLNGYFTSGSYPGTPGVGAGSSYSGGSPGGGTASYGGGGGGATDVSVSSGCATSNAVVAGGGGGGGGGGGSRGAAGGAGGNGAATYSGSTLNTSTPATGMAGLLGEVGTGTTLSGAFGTTDSGGGGGDGGGSGSGSNGPAGSSTGATGGGGGSAGSSAVPSNAGPDVVYGANPQGPQDWPWPAGISNSLMNGGFGNLGGEDLGGQPQICAWCNVTGPGGLAQGYALITWGSHKPPPTGLTTITSIVTEPNTPDGTTW
jgi:hypothetical protein